MSMNDARSPAGAIATLVDRDTPEEREVVDDLLTDVWQAARRAGLPAGEAAAACRVMLLRAADVIEAGGVPQQGAPRDAGWWWEEIGTEVERLRRAAEWEASVRLRGAIVAEAS